MPRVSIYQEKYMEADAVAFIEGKTRESRQTDKDIAEAIGLSAPSYCIRKRDGHMKFGYMELVKMFQKLNLSDEDILNLMKGKIGRCRV